MASFPNARNFGKGPPKGNARDQILSRAHGKIRDLMLKWNTSAMYRTQATVDEIRKQEAILKDQGAPYMPFKGRLP